MKRSALVLIMALASLMAASAAAQAAHGVTAARSLLGADVSVATAETGTALRPVIHVADNNDDDDGDYKKKKKKPQLQTRFFEE